MRTMHRFFLPTVALVFGASVASRAQSGSPTLEAKLVDAEKNAAKKAATVMVTVNGVQMTDPASVGEKPMKGQGHLHYRVDDGPVIATTSTKLAFHDLKPGAHTFEVVLAANDHSPLGPKQTLKVTVPGNAPTNSH